MRPSYKACIVVISSLFLNVGCNQENTSSANELVTTKVSAVGFDKIIPLPVKAQQSEGNFVLNDVEYIHVSSNNLKLSELAQQLKKDLLPLNNATIADAISQDGKPHIVLSIDPSIEGGDEGYQLTITKNVLTLVGGSEVGVFRGIQTLEQLLPVDSKNNQVELNTGAIEDYPRFEYRGFMLDVARHFYTVEEVKEVIDYLATYKYNTFHFHLTDDQGWRIEIPSWPKLTTVGSNSAVGQKTCDNCFYTLDEYQEIVQYADDNFITLIPEIDVPGHVKAALASYPDELYCEGDKPDWPYTGIEVRISSLCFSNPEIYTFFDDVVSEVAKRTTGEYIHIGGDETPKWVKHEDFSEFMLKASDIVTKHGKTLVGWTNDLGSVEGLSKDVVGQHWTTNKHCCEATLNMANRGSKIIMSPANKAYLDLKYDIDSPLGLVWAGYNSIENSYNWDPDKIIAGVNPENIIGVEAALWGETITSMADAQYMIFPRLLSLSEVAWSPQKQRDWKSFSKRLKSEINDLKTQGLNYRPISYRNSVKQ